MRFFDTSSLLEDCSDLSDVVISSISIQELENIKTSSRRDNEIKAKSRKAVREIERQNVRIITYNPDWDDILTNGYGIEANNDNRIILTAFFTSEDVDCICSEDYLFRFIAKSIFNLETKSIKRNNSDEYVGYIDITVTEKELSYLYSNKTENKFNLLTNQYAILRFSNGEIVDKIKWNGYEYVPISVSKIGNDFMGKVKPINEEQCLAFDLIQDDRITIKVLTGEMGTGKDFCMVSHAVQKLKDHTIDKIVLVRNNIEVKDSKEFGYLPNGLDEKLEWLTYPIQDALGGKDGYDLFANRKQIEILPLNFCRGRDIKNAIVYVTEAENMTKEHIQLLIGRIGEGSQLWINGDSKQIDDKTFELNNGLKTIINKLKGEKLFGIVNLKKVERSETAKLAKKLDD